MSSDATAVEPELCGPLPRTVRARLRRRAIRWCLVCLLIALPGSLLWEAHRRQEKYDTLRRDGIETRAVAMSKSQELVRWSTYYYGNFRYFNGRREYLIQEVLDAKEFKTFKIGRVRRVIYSSEDPAYSWFKEDLEANETSSIAILWKVAAGIVAAVLLMILLGSEVERARLRRLAVGGIPFLVDTVNISDESKRKDGTQWVLTYYFDHGGRTYEGRVPISAAIAERLSESDDPLTVLRDPKDPSRHELYIRIARSFKIAMSDVSAAAVV